METRIILHNSVSLDCSFIGLTPDMEEHCRIVNSYKPDVYMAGSNTAKTGIETYRDTGQQETEADFVKPARDKSLSYWFIPDSKGILKGLLHHYRRFEYCRDVIILMTETTPVDYLKYLAQRQYDYIIAGKNNEDFRDAVRQLAEKYAVSTIWVDTGSRLGNVLLNNDLVDEISLAISPEIPGMLSQNLFERVERKIDLRLKSCETLKKGYIWVTYEVKKNINPL